jgi:single-strand DNA-binding protein
MINEATLIGRIGKKDIRPLKNGTEVATLYIATSKKWLDANGNQTEQTTWHNVNFFNKLADIVKRYAHVGGLVYIKGEINNKQIEKGERQGQWAYSVTGSQIKLLPSSTKKNGQETKPQESPENQRFAEELGDEYIDDIPF